MSKIFYGLLFETFEGGKDEKLKLFESDDIFIVNNYDKFLKEKYDVSFTQTQREKFYHKHFNYKKISVFDAGYSRDYDLGKCFCVSVGDSISSYSDNPKKIPLHLENVLDIPQNANEVLEKWCEFFNIEYDESKVAVWLVSDV